MKRFSLLVLLVLPMALLSQDFTMEGGYAEEAVEQPATLLIVPFHQNYYLSEIDGLLTDQKNLDSRQLRKKLRTYLTRSLDQQFSDSIETRNLLVGKSETLEYIYNGIDYRYVELEEKEEEGETWLQKKLKKKEEANVYGASTQRENGQLKSKDILFDRYMAADIGNPGMMEYLKDEFHHSHVLFINELDLRRDTQKGETIYGETDYTVTVHYTLVNQKGQTICGGKVSESLTIDEASVEQLTDITFNALAKQIISEAYVYLAAGESTNDSAVEDY